MEDRYLNLKPECATNPLSLPPPSSFLRIVSVFNSLGTLILLMPVGLFWGLHNGTLTWTALSLPYVCDLFHRETTAPPFTARSIRESSCCTAKQGSALALPETLLSTSSPWSPRLLSASPCCEVIDSQSAWRPAQPVFEFSRFLNIPLTGGRRTELDWV